MKVLVEGRRECYWQIRNTLILRVVRYLRRELRRIHWFYTDEKSWISVEYRVSVPKPTQVGEARSLRCARETNVKELGKLAP